MTAEQPYGREAAARIVAELDLRESDRPVRDMIDGWARPKKIIVRDDPGDPNRALRLAWLQTAAPGVELTPASDNAQALTQVSDADGMMGYFWSPDLFKAGKHLRWTHWQAAGVEFFTETPEILSGQVLLTNHQRVYGPAMAEHVIALVLALTRGLDVYVRMNHDRRFIGFGMADQAIPMSRLRELSGATLLVVGLGGIGTAVAKIAHGFGMRVVATRNSSRDAPAFVERVELAADLPDLIGEADVVVMTAPLTPGTTGLFDASMFARMKRGAYFVNVGRGASVVTEDLIAALHEGQVGGAGLDVVEPEPLPDGHPLFDAPNTVLTPRMSSLAVGDGPYGERMWAVTWEILRRYVAGEKVFSVVDPRRGY